jgi:hypothetical protein
MILKLITTSAVLLGFASCMPSKQAPAPSQQPPSTQTPNETSDQTTKTTLKDIGASKLIVTRGTSKVSFADIAKQNSAELTVFQFSGPDCVPCMEHSPGVARSIAKYGSRASMVVVFPNAIESYPTSAYQNFTSSYAANAPYVIDETRSVLKAIRANVTQSFGLYVLVNKAGLGQILNMDDAYTQVDSAVAAALGVQK